jgi:hypothetical protein
MFTFDHRLGFHQAFFQVYRLSRPVIQLVVLEIFCERCLYIPYHIPLTIIKCRQSRPHKTLPFIRNP